MSPSSLPTKTLLHFPRAGQRRQDIVNEELEKWKAKGVEGHFEGERPWVSIDETVEDGLGRIVVRPSAVHWV